MFRRTIDNDVIVRGIGTFSAQQVEVKLCPSNCGMGIRFIRDDLEDNNIIVVKYDAIYNQGRMSTCISNGYCKIEVIEHILSALWGLNITDIDIHLNKEEIPLIDGSSICWIRAIEYAGIKEFEEKISFKKINKEIKVEDGDKYIIAKPYDCLKISYTIDFKDNFIGKNIFVFDDKQDSYIKEISYARTFCTDKQEDEHKKIKKYFSTNELIIFSENNFSVIGNKLRYQNEATRHKILDLIGDLMSSGEFICGEFICYKSGHFLNREIIKKIFQS